jgi:small GTP-binding protein
MVFDTGGQEFISTLRKRYYHGAAGAIVVFDMCARESFDGLSKWINELQKEIPGVHTLIVANKSDLLEQRTVTTDEGKTFAADNNAEYHETSALTGDNVDKIFQVFVNKLLESSNN